MNTSKNKLLNLRSTHFLKLVIIVLGISAISFGSVLLYVSFATDDAGFYQPVLLGMVLSLLPFLMGLMEAFKLLNYIGNNLAFSELSVKALKKIKMFALVISGLYAVGMPYIFYVAEKDDAPGVVLLGLILVFVPLVVAVFAAILQELLQNASEIKSENDLTV
ncbi:MAG: DUF2975 domain-containing protein [Bacteroidetes bacterium]|jgi:peptidoglycan/LPS O-acetylase OafA/YrhL|nr:DUF2975 domain-containing protein [Bacteroidota bacterium]